MCLSSVGYTNDNDLSKQYWAKTLWTNEYFFSSIVDGDERQRHGDQTMNYQWIWSSSNCSKGEERKEELMSRSQKREKLLSVCLCLSHLALVKKERTAMNQRSRHLNHWYWIIYWRFIRNRIQTSINKWQIEMYRNDVLMSESISMNSLLKERTTSNLCSTNSNDFTDIEKMWIIESNSWHWRQQCKRDYDIEYRRTFPRTRHLNNL